MSQTISLRVLLLFVGVLIIPTGCQRDRRSVQGPEVPADLQETIDHLVQAVEVLDIAAVLDAYAEDYASGTGRSKDDVRRTFEQLRENRVSLKIEEVTVEKADLTEAKLRTRIRIRYLDRFRDLGEGEVVVTDVLMHSLRKETESWKIYADERVATYREGRFGQSPPNVEIQVPEKLPTDLHYPVKVTVRREAGADYQVMLGNYAEDPAVLPPPDIVTDLPESGVLEANLIPNPQGRGEMVRITVITADADGKWIGATTVSKFVPGHQRKKKEPRQEMV